MGRSVPRRIHRGPREIVDLRPVSQRASVMSTPGGAGNAVLGMIMNAAPPRFIFPHQRLPTLMALSTYPRVSAPIAARISSFIFLRERIMRSYGLGRRLITRGSTRLGR